jgi:hypothetical protein
MGFRGTETAIAQNSSNLKTSLQLSQEVILNTGIFLGSKLLWAGGKRKSIRIDPRLQK